MLGEDNFKETEETNDILNTIVDIEQKKQNKKRPGTAATVTEASQRPTHDQRRGYYSPSAPPSQGGSHEKENFRLSAGYGSRDDRTARPSIHSVNNYSI